MSRVRTFVGIPLSEDATSAFLRARDAYIAADPTWAGEKWVPRENLHVTLKFIGGVEEDVLAELTEAISAAAKAHESFELFDAGLRAVPGQTKARMLWGTFVDPEGCCGALAAELDRACLRFGAQPEERTFKPHATLVRARAPRPIHEAALDAARGELTVLPRAMSVPSITVFSSRLTPQGPIYTALRECGLGAA